MSEADSLSAQWLARIKQSGGVITVDELDEMETSIAAARCAEAIASLEHDDVWAHCDYPSVVEVQAALKFIGRNHRPGLVVDLHELELLSPQAAAWAVPDAWCSAEYPERAVEREFWLELFEHAGYSLDREPAERPSERLRLWRGASARGSARMAWTSDLSVAQRFATDIRGREPGVVWTALVEPGRLLASIADVRNESEYVINPTGLEITRWAEG